MELTYETLLDEALDAGLDVKEKKLQSVDGLQVGTRIAIRKDIEMSNKKMCVLAEEIGHYMTSAGNILDQSDLNNAKQERRARVWAFNRVIPVERIIEAASKGYTQVYEMAEYLDVDEEFLREGLTYHRILDISL